MAGSQGEASELSELPEVSIDPIALDEINEATIYYDTQRVGLGFEFLSQAFRTIDLIRERPVSYAAIAVDLHRANLNRFPDAVFYKIDEEGIVIVGCVHGKRHPRTWESRS